MTGTPKQRDLKLRTCVNSIKFDGEQIELKTDALRHVVDTYSRNVRRVFNLILFPSAAVNIAMTTQRVIDRIEHQNPGKSADERASLATVAVNQELANVRAVLDRGDAKSKRLFETQQDMAFLMLSKQNPDLYDGPEAWMASQVIATWTAFEAMAEDLWEAALNLKPKSLAKLKGRNASQPLKDGDDPKRIRLDSIFKYDFDIGHRMGTIFLEENRYSFDTLSGIREAYKHAFSEDGESVLKLLNSKSLDAISLVRNNLVHNGGVVDKQIRSRSSDLPPQLRALSVGEPILLDGEIVSALNRPVIDNGGDLLVAVDSWLATH
jgi:hypothetical protein